LLVVALLVAAGVAFTAFALTSLLDGSIGTWLSRPFAASGHPRGGEEVLAWFVAVLAWGRGLWLGWEEPGSRQVTGAIVISALAFLVFFLADAARRHDPGFSAETLPASILLLVCAPASLAALALVTERELERWRLRRPSARPSVAWLAAVMVPMLAVAVLALLVAVAGGPLRPIVDTAVRDTFRGIGAVVSRLARLLTEWLHLKPVALKPTSAFGVRVPPGSVRISNAHVKTPLWLKVLALSILALLAALVLAVLVKLLRRLIAALRLPVRVDRGTADEDSDSVFSWAHLMDQLGEALRRLFGFRSRRRGAPPTAAARLAPGAGEATGEWREEASVRSHYRRVLRAARQAGQGRMPAETPLELERRLAELAAGAGSDTLGQLTDLYDLARYASDQSDASRSALGGPGIELAGRCADLLVDTLQPAAAEPSS
jgi:hypothetical protein